VKILFVADVVGKPGRQAIVKLLPPLIEETGAALTVVNGENAAGGAGITRAIVREILDAGAHAITTGNHVWDNKDAVDYIGREPRLLRPANMPSAAPGRGEVRVRAANGVEALVVNVMGRVFMNPIDCPFRAADRAIDANGDTKIRLVDMHAEATSEKLAMGHYLDGRVSAVVGTHTHVATADERVLPGGTAYITDAGMTGPYASIIGVKKEAVLRRMTTGLPTRFETATADARLAGVLIDADETTGKASAIERVERRLDP
jgi:metallophosphoesterase (TIGR00282 family)